MAKIENYATTVGEPETQTMKLRFPAPIRQVDATTIEITLPVRFGAVWNEGFAQHLEQQVGKRDAAVMLDDAADKLMLQEITSQIRRG